VPRIEATLVRDGDFEKVRDHTFSQLTAMVADVRGSMMLPVSGSPTRNFQAGQVLAMRMQEQAVARIPWKNSKSGVKPPGCEKGGWKG
jgi:hypothetical protein